MDLLEAQRYLTPEEQAELDSVLKDIQPVYYDPAFTAQTAFILDPARFKVAFCSRRSGKSFGICLYMLTVALASPGANIIYLGLSRDSAKKAVWKDGILTLLTKYGINASVNETDLTVTFETGSVIYILGAEADNVKERVRGGKFSLAVVDEAQRFGSNLLSFVTEVLMPTLTDTLGTICLLGTPGDLRFGLFFELTGTQDASTPGTWTVKHPESAATWTGHRWTALDNPHVRANELTVREAMKEANPLVELLPSYQRERLGRWVADNTRHVSKYRTPENDYSALPTLRGATWYHVMGLDLGWEDPTAFVICAYNDAEPILYVVEAFAQRHMIYPEVEAKLLELDKRYSLDRIIVDGAAKQGVETMRIKRGLSLNAAQKTDKATNIEVMNGDFISGRILLGPNTQPLKEEISKLVWDDPEKTDKRREDPSCDNHCHDALLYAWRDCHNHLSKPRKDVKPYTKAWWDDQLEEMTNYSLNKQAETTVPDFDDAGFVW